MSRGEPHEPDNERGAKVTPLREPSGSVGTIDFSVAGFSIYPRALTPEQLVCFRAEADRITAESGTACVRHLRHKSQVFDELASGATFRGIAGPGLRPVRSILFDKTAAENWAVPWHQDLTIAVAKRVEVPGFGPWSIKDGLPHVQPPVDLLERMVTLRLHLDDTPAENGALRIIPGSHRHGRLGAEAIQSARGREVVCACGAGDILLMRPLVLHASSRSAAPMRRRVIHVEFAPREALDARLEWAETWEGSAHHQGG